MTTRNIFVEHSMQFRQAVTFVGWSPILVTIHRGQGGTSGVRVLRISSDRDDRMGADLSDNFC